MSHAPTGPARSVAEAQQALRALAARWQDSDLKERQAFTRGNLPRIGPVLIVDAVSDRLGGSHA